ncbi:MAG: dCTP deaminase [Candidatus Dependentiae bacterium]
MILSADEIKKALDRGDIEINPFNASHLGSNSYDLHLHNELLVYKDRTLDMKKDNNTERIQIPQAGFEMQPGKIYLGRSKEWTATNVYAPMLEGRSSIGRLGLYVHITAGFGNIGSSGFWTLELSCVQPLVIYPDVAVCQIFFMTVQGAKTLFPEKNKYKDADDIQASKLWQEF